MTLEPPTWNFTSGNPATVAMFGTRDADHFVSLAPWELSPERQPDGRASGEKAKEMIETAVRDGSHFFEWTHRRVNGESFPATVLLSRMETGGKVFLQASVRDITAIRKAEDRVRMARDVLSCLNHAGTTKAAIHGILQVVKQNTGLEAVGIRLRDGDDFPYCETNGFLDHFVELERYLCARDAAGKIVHDTAGTPVLECMCGNVICARTDPKYPFFTPNGSFWTNGTTQLLASTTAEDRQAHTRNRCNGAGYESVALIPLRSGDETIGLLQLNDHRRDQFTLEMIQFFEGLGASIGTAVSRVRTETALQESRALLNETGRIAKIGGWELDVETLQQVWTEEVHRIHEVDMTYKPTVQAGIAFYGPAARPIIEQAVRRAIEQGEPFDVELELITARGNHRWVHAVGKAYQEYGKTRKVSGSFQDITERKRLETERRELEKQLHEKQKLAAVGTLACGMGHEINNPIMGIINYAQLIKDGLHGKNEALEEFAGEIVIEAERIAGIVRGLSAFATRDIATRAAVPVSDLIESALSATRDTLLRDHIKLEVDVPGNLPAVSCDRRQIVDVLTGLLSNARDALNEKYPGHDENKIVRISARTIAECGLQIADSGKAADNVSSQSEHASVRNPHSAIRITVADHGAGIPDTVREHIFEPFFTTKDKSVGAGNIGKGLGLFVSFATVQEHGGSLSVESPSTPLRAGPSTPLRAGPSTPLRAGPSAPCRAGETGQWTRFCVDLPVEAEAGGQRCEVPVQALQSRHART